jgi:hypothetical protein
MRRESAVPERLRDTELRHVIDFKHSQEARDVATAATEFTPNPS